MLRESQSANYRVADGPVLGIVGGGQLARMLIEAAIRLDVDVRVLVASADDCVAAISPAVVVGDHRDADAVRDFARSCDVVTFDHERTPPAVLDAVAASGAVLRPGSAAMTLASDKLEQRRVAAQVGVPVAPYAVVGEPDELVAAAARLGGPVVAKATTGGYDGRGVRWLRSAADVADLADELALERSTWVVEPELDIETELAVQIVRRPSGEVAVYPVVETVQVDGICTTASAPAGVAPGLTDQLVGAAHRLADRIDLVGVLAVEAFVVGGQLLLNELAPRPHNSGHHTIDACVTSQFENHVRAVLDLPLGDTSLVAPAAVMANIIATGPALAPLRDVPLPGGVTIHLYGKEPRAGRKVGHVTALGSARPVLEHAALDTARAVAEPGAGHRVAGERSAVPA